MKPERKGIVMKTRLAALRAVGLVLPLLVAAAATAADPDEVLVLPSLGRQPALAVECAEDFPPTCKFEVQPERRVARLGEAGQAVTVELRQVKGDLAALRAVLPTLTDKDTAAVRRVAWNGASAWLVDLTLDPATHPPPAAPRFRCLITPFQDGHLLLSFSGTAEALQAQRPGLLGIATGLHFVVPGLVGDYFATMDFRERALTRVDPQVDFDWGTNPPATEVPATGYSVQWHGLVIPRFTETYSFHTVSDDGVRLFVKGQKLLENWTVHAAVEDTGTIDLEAGKPCELRLEFYQNLGLSVARLLWSSKNQAREVLPQAGLRCQPPAGVVAMRPPNLTTGTAAGWPELVGGVTPGDFVSTLPPGLTWQGVPPQQRLRLGAGEAIVAVELRLEEAVGIADVPTLVPTAAAEDVATITPVQWKNAPAWRAEFRLAQAAHPDLKYRYQRYYLCPTRSGVLVLVFKAPTPETVEQQQDPLRQLMGGIQFIEKVRETTLFGEEPAAR